MTARRTRIRTYRVAAVQLPFRVLPNFEAVREYLLRHLLPARQQGVRLAVLPAYTGLLVLHLFTSTSLVSWHQLQEACQRFGAAAEETLLDWARRLAQYLDLYLIPGTCLVPGHQGLLHRAYIFAPSGKLLGHQDQTHLGAWDLEFGLAAGTELPVWDVDGFQLGLAVGNDAWVPEVGRILALQGATVVVCPTAVPAPYTYHRQLAGAWRQTQDNHFYSIECSASGELGGRRFQGRSAIFAPSALTPGGHGYLVEPGQTGANHMAVADLDPARLVPVRGKQFNIALYADAFPKLYIKRLATMGIHPLVEEYEYTKDQLA